MSIRIGILGGTFDPVHNGHIYLAKKVIKKLKLSKVIFIPAYIPPHKKGIKVTQAKHRYNMLKLATGGDKKFKVSNMEIKRKGRSYSVETLRSLRKKYGSRAELFFITGSDSLMELDKWKNLEEILSLCKFVVVERPGFKAGDIPKSFMRTSAKDNSAHGIIFLKINAKNISSTDIRNKVKTLKSVSGIVSAKVEDYIGINKLYV